MTKAGKKYTDAAKLIEAGKAYTPKEAVELVKKTSVTKFDSTVECSVRLGVDPKYADQQVRGALVLPHGTGKSKTVLVFAAVQKLRKLRMQVLTLLVLKSSLTRSKAAGSTLTSA